MANSQHVAAVKGGAGTLANWRAVNRGVTLDLAGENLSGLVLPPNADLSNADLRGTNLTGAVLPGANFTASDLAGAILDRADLSGAEFTRANLKGVRAAGAGLGGVKPPGALGAVAGGTSGDGWGGSLDTRLFYLLGTLAVLALLLIAALAFFSDIADTGKARGLITVVFTIGTIAIAISLLASRWMASSPDSAERFQGTKEILTILVGIMGTIIGWYFGQEENGEALFAPPVIRNVTFTPRQGEAGETVMLRATLRGGRPPYSYTVAFGAQRENGTTTTHEIKKSFELRLPAGATGPTPIDVEVSVVDDANNEAQFTVPEDARPIVNPRATAGGASSNGQ